MATVPDRSGNSPIGMGVDLHINPPDPVQRKTVHPQPPPTGVKL
jgi:hypothetical protein